jgi:hypothetical protein
MGGTRSPEPRRSSRHYDDYDSDRGRGSHSRRDRKRSHRDESSDEEDRKSRRRGKEREKDHDKKRCVPCVVALRAVPSGLTCCGCRDKHRETEAERAERKARKKAAKREEALRAKEEEERQLAAQLSVYSSQDNPFHDANLGQQFVWGKKREMEKKKGISQEEARRREAERRAEAQVCSPKLTLPVMLLNACDTGGAEAPRATPSGA